MQWHCKREGLTDKIVHLKLMMHNYKFATTDVTDAVKSKLSKTVL